MIDPDTFGRICAYTAHLLMNNAPHVEREVIANFADLDAEDVADVVEGATEQWTRLREQWLANVPAEPPIDRLVKQITAGISDGGRQ